eukprot:m.41922 g.41922  ORF g.41922 m.41922 type:complete len:633 (+) comp7029_c1_seq1:49-1947(+)
MGKTRFVNGFVWCWDEIDGDGCICSGQRKRGEVCIEDGIIKSITTTTTTMDNNPSCDFVDEEEIEIVNLEGATIFPGLQDAHLHVGILGQYMEKIDLSNCKSIKDLLDTMKEGEKALPDSAWCVGVNFDHEKLFERRWPTRQELDTVSTSRVVFCFRVCVHIVVGNSLGLEAMKIPLHRRSFRREKCNRKKKKKNEDGIGHENDDDDDNGDNGDDDELVEYDISGNATGLLKEGECYKVSHAMDHSVSFERMCDQFEHGLKECLKFGTTCVQTNDANGWKVYQHLLENNRIPIRVHLTVLFDELGTCKAPPHPLVFDNNDMLRCERVKVFADGSLGAETAALSIPYRCKHVTHSTCSHSDYGDDDMKSKAETEDDGTPERKRATTTNGQRTTGLGILNYARAELERMVRVGHENKFQLEVHAIGDKAAEEVVGAFQRAGLSPEDRPILTHCQVLREDILDMMAEQKVVANIQPSFVVTDANWVLKRLPKRLLSSAYVWNTMLERKIPCSGGSDAPVETANPLQGMYDAIFRNISHDAEGGDEDKQRNLRFKQEECLTFAQALHLYTLGAAYAGKSETRRGKVEPGFDADFTIIKEDVMNNPHLLRDISPFQVWVAGIRRDEMLACAIVSDQQ